MSLSDADAAVLRNALFHEQDKCARLAAEVARQRKALRACLPFVSWPLAKHMALHLEETACDEHDICATVSDAMINEAERLCRAALAPREHADKHTPGCAHTNLAVGNCCEGNDNYLARAPQSGDGSDSAHPPLPRRGCEAMIGEVHNAKHCTIDGRDCWIASVVPFDTSDGVPLALKVSEHATQDEALAWLRASAARRGEALTLIGEDQP